MENIKAYIDELEEQLYEWDDGPINWHCELAKLQDVIKQLMHATFVSVDGTEKVKLATLEYRAKAHPGLHLEKESDEELKTKLSSHTA